jgi:hypothetical protein
MAIQHGTDLRNAMMNTYESTIGTAPILELRSGAPPANCAAADSGTLLASITLPSDWLTAASNGAKTINNGPWTDSSANNTGTLGHYRLKDSGGTTCHEQGTITATGGGGDIEVDNTSVTAGQSVSITSWTRTADNA